MTSHCQEYVEWMEKNGGITKGKGKRKRFLLFNCLDEKGGCRGCPESETCDLCNAKVCIYLARYDNDYLLCPECWENYADCAEDDRMKKKI